MTSSEDHAPATLTLGDESNAFARGGNRLCFVHPHDSNKVVKVLRRDRLPAIKRAEKSFPKRLKPEIFFDDNWQEKRVYRRIEASIGEAAYELIPRCHGFVNTDWGRGLCTDLIRDDDGRVSISLKQFLWTEGQTEALTSVLAEFSSQWQALGMPSRNLLLHNMVVVTCDKIPTKIQVIDGLGWPDLVPLAYWMPTLARGKAAKKLRLLEGTILKLLEKKAQNADYGYHGWLNDNVR